MAAPDTRAPAPTATLDGTTPVTGAPAGGTRFRPVGPARAEARGRDDGLATLADRLQLDDIGKAYLRDRWLAQVEWLGRSARRHQRRYYALRLISILGGVAIPALVGLNVAGGGADAVGWLTFGLGLLVAAAVALEEFFRHGEHWRHYRQQAELLRAEGWAFLELAGPAYRRYDSHAEALRAFVGRVEDAVRQEVGVYMAEVARTSETQRADDPLPSGAVAATQAAQRAGAPSARADPGQRG
jgi:Protein of unknown function (DUF4231)